MEAFEWQPCDKRGRIQKAPVAVRLSEEEAALCRQLAVTVRGCLTVSFLMDAKALMPGTTFRRDV